MTDNDVTLTARHYWRLIGLFVLAVIALGTASYVVEAGQQCRTFNIWYVFIHVPACKGDIQPAEPSVIFAIVLLFLFVVWMLKRVKSWVMT